MCIRDRSGLVDIVNRSIRSKGRITGEASHLDLSRLKVLTSQIRPKRSIEFRQEEIQIWLRKVSGRTPIKSAARSGLSVWTEEWNNHRFDKPELAVYGSTSKALAGLIDRASELVINPVFARRTDRG